MSDKTYYVRFPIHGYVDVTVTATSEEEAIEKGYEECGSEDASLDWTCGHPDNPGPEHEVEEAKDIEP